MASATPHDDLYRLPMEGELTIYTAQETKKALLDALHDHPLLAVDLSSVTELDTAGIQLLMLSKQEAEREGKEIRFVSPSQAAKELIGLYELTSYFGVTAPPPTATV